MKLSQLVTNHNNMRDTALQVAADKAANEKAAKEIAEQELIVKINSTLKAINGIKGFETIFVECGGNTITFKPHSVSFYGICAFDAQGHYLSATTAGWVHDGVLRDFFSHQDCEKCIVRTLEQSLWFHAV
jgi:hypothetical protein